MQRLTERQQIGLNTLQIRLESNKLIDHHVEVRNDKYCLFYKTTMLIAQHKDHEKLWSDFEKYRRSIQDN